MQSQGNLMKLPRRRVLHLAAGAAALPAVSRIAWAQAYPARPVTLIVFVPAGGTPDIIARLIGQSLSQRLGQSVVIDNRPGAGGNLALQAVARTPADGYTLLLVATPHVINVTLYEKSTVTVTRDIVPVASINNDSFVLLVNPSFPAKTVPEFIAHAKANPGKINLASNGTGNLTHLSGELFRISRWCTCPIEARPPRIQHSWRATCMRCSMPLGQRCRISNRVGCGRLE
jgi:tripartite-type tricarboxylate transporter receptor subunit TctC